jgi:hypothetical protein
MVFTFRMKRRKGRRPAAFSQLYASALLKRVVNDRRTVKPALA